MNNRQKLELYAELFALCVHSSDGDKKRAEAIIRKFTYEDRRDVLAGVQTLCGMMDDLFLAGRREERIEKRKQ